MHRARSGAAAGVSDRRCRAPGFRGRAAARSVSSSLIASPPGSLFRSWRRGAALHKAPDRFFDRGVGRGAVRGDAAVGPFDAAIAGADLRLGQHEQPAIEAALRGQSRSSRVWRLGIERRRDPARRYAASRRVGESNRWRAPGSRRSGSRAISFGAQFAAASATATSIASASTPLFDRRRGRARRLSSDRAMCSASRRGRACGCAPALPAGRPRSPCDEPLGLGLRDLGVGARRAEWCLPTLRRGRSRYRTGIWRDALINRPAPRRRGFLEITDFALGGEVLGQIDQQRLRFVDIAQAHRRPARPCRRSASWRRATTCC